MDPGLLALLGIFGLAAICAFWGFSHRRSIERRLAAQGFEPCDAEAPSLEGAWRTLAGCDASHELRLVHCRRRAGTRRALYHFTVRERPEQTATHETASPGASYPAYLLEVPNPTSVARGAVTLHVLPPGSAIMRKLLAGVIGLGVSRAKLEVGTYPWSASIVAAHGSTPGKLDDLVPQAVQEKIARAAAHGFFIIHLADGKAAFAALSNHRDVDRQLSYLAEWA